MQISKRGTLHNEHWNLIGKEFAISQIMREFFFCRSKSILACVIQRRLHSTKDRHLKEIRVYNGQNKVNMCVQIATNNKDLQEKDKLESIKQNVAERKR